jgi:manganese/zinc/iron transport system permease protein
MDEFLIRIEVFTDVLFLTNYNTRLVVLSTLILGIASGVVGSFLLLRKRSLIADALSHACLPGIGVAFYLMTALGGYGKFLPGLLLGASISGVLGILVVMAIKNTTRIKDDAAMGIVLSIFFGAGIAILGMIQAMPSASAAGLESFIYGKTASLLQHDFWLLTSIAVVTVICCILFYKEFTLVCFDQNYAASQGWPVLVLDVFMLLLVAAITVVALQAVGLILVIAFLIIPSAAARFWTHQLGKMLWIAALIGGFSGWLGSSLSALLPDFPAGAVIVLAAGIVFLLSMIFGPAKGVLVRHREHSKLKMKIGREHFLRAVYEILERSANRESLEVSNLPILRKELESHRSWCAAELKALLQLAKREDHIEQVDSEKLLLSESGFGEATRLARNHRLWEMYLIEYADVAPNNVDRGADTVEHVLGADIVRKLEEKIFKNQSALRIPVSPHNIKSGRDL